MVPGPSALTEKPWAVPEFRGGRVGFPYGCARVYTQKYMGSIKWSPWVMTLKNKEKKKRGQEVGSGEVRVDLGRVKGKSWR